MTITQLKQELNNRGITLTVEGGRLKVEAPAGALMPELREELAQQKDALLFDLAVTEAGSSSDPLYVTCQRARYPITFEWPNGSLTTYNTPEEAYNDLWTRSILIETQILGGIINPENETQE
jgi:hypothetical protein